MKFTLQAGTFLEAIKNIVGECPRAFVVNVVNPEGQQEENLVFADDAPLMGKYVDHINNEGEDETFLVQRARCTLGTILVMYHEDGPDEVFYVKAPRLGV